MIVSLRNGILTCFSLPLPPCGRLVLALPSVGLVGALAGAPFCFASLFPLFFLLSGIAPGFARMAVCLTVEVGTHFGSRRIAILFKHKRRLDLPTGCSTKLLQHSCATPPKSSKNFGVVAERTTLPDLNNTRHVGDSKHYVTDDHSCR